MALRVHQQQRVVVLPKGGGADIANQQGNALSRPFGCGMGQQVMAFGGKTHAEKVAFQRMGRPGDGGQNVGVLDKLQRWGLARAVFFDLLVRRVGRAPVGHRSRGNKHRGSLHMPLHGRQHFLGRLHIDAPHTAWRGHMHRPRDQGDIGTRLARRTGHGKAHLSARQVGDATHRIDGFKRGPRRDEHRPARKGLGREKSDQLVQQLQRLQHAAVTRLATGLVAIAHAQHHGAVLRHLRQIALRGGMGPHFAVHGRGQQQRHALRGARQTQQAEQLVRPALHQARNEVRTARCNQDRIRLAAQIDVGHVVGLAGIPLRAIHRAA